MSISVYPQITQITQKGVEQEQDAESSTGVLIFQLATYRLLPTAFCLLNLCNLRNLWILALSTQIH